MTGPCEKGPSRVVGPVDNCVFPAADQWTDVVCNLAGCGGCLYIERTESLAIMAGTTTNELRGDTHSASWQVVCSNGHTILVPEKDEETPRFGLCDWHDDESGDEPHECPRNDMARLRLVAALATQNDRGRAHA